MTIRHLKVFITVAECGKMVGAAEKLFISQPSVSQAIRELEDHYGVKLFERLSKKLYITESGELLLRYARHIIESFGEMEVQLKYTGQHVCLRIGATITVGTCILPPIIENFEKQYKGIKTRGVVNNTNVIQQMLLRSQLELAIVEGDVSHPDLVEKPLYQDALVLAVGRTHPLYGQECVKIQALEGQDLICREKGSGVRSLFEQALLENNVSMPIKWECTTTEAIKAVTIGGQGIGIFSESMIKEEVKNAILHIVRLDKITLSREICVIWHKNKFMSEHFKNFLDYLGS